MSVQKWLPLFSFAALLAPLEAWAQDPASLPIPPNGYDQRRNNVPQGNVQVVNYATRNHGQEVMRVYTPPGYVESEEYPTLYLLHGIGGDENEWFTGGAPHIILDNLLAEQKIVPMVLVLPNGKTPKSAGNQGFDNFGDVLINDLIPFMEENYSVSSKQIDRALAGLSMGGGQTVNFGFPNTDVFAWIGAFSPAPNSRSAQQTITDVNAVKNNLQFIFLSNGETEVQPYHPITQGYRDFLTAQNIPYMYQREPGAGHDFTAWKRSLYNFSQRIFTHTDDSTAGGDSTSGETSSGEPNSTGEESSSGSGADAGASSQAPTSSSSESSESTAPSTSGPDNPAPVNPAPVTPTAVAPTPVNPTPTSTAPTTPVTPTVPAPTNGTDDGSVAGESGNNDGCACRVAGGTPTSATPGWSLAVLAVAAAAFVRRKQRAAV